MCINDSSHTHSKTEQHTSTDWTENSILSDIVIVLHVNTSCSQLLLGHSLIIIISIPVLDNMVCMLVSSQWCIQPYKIILWTFKMCLELNGGSLTCNYLCFMMHSSVIIYSCYLSVGCWKLGQHNVIHACNAAGHKRCLRRVGMDRRLLNS